MRAMTLELPSGDEPLYRRMASAVRRAMRDGRLQPGELLPSTRSLADLWGAHRHTVMTALDELVAEGWLEPEAGRGFRVAPEAPPKAPRLASHGGRREWEIARSMDIPQGLDAGCRYRFPSGQPDLRRFPAQEYLAMLREALRDEKEAVLGYVDAGGYPPLIEELRTYLRRLRGIAEGEVVVTNGSQEAIFLLAQVLLKPHDRVALETMGYRPAWAALRAAGAELVGLEMDAEGLVPESLERVARKVRMLYLTPLHQYPTTVTLSVPRREALYRIAARHGVAILEDDYDHEFHYRCRPIAPMKASDPGQIVLYVSTFSKVLAPSTRLGYAVVPPGVAPALRGAKQVSSRQNDPLVQAAVARWMADGGLERHLRRMRLVYEGRLDVMMEALEEGARSHGLALRCARPQGGMSVWASLGVDGDALAEAARRRDVAIHPGSAFRLVPGKSDHVRLGFASLDPEDISEGVRRIAEAAREVRGGAGGRDDRGSGARGGRGSGPGA